MGHTAITERSEDATRPALRVRDDTVQYLHMIEGEEDQAKAPQRYRLLVPAIARLLPLEPLDALRTITYATLFGSLVVAFALGRILRLPFDALSVALASIVAAPTMAYNFHNPFLSDGAGLFAISVAAYAFLVTNALLFIITIGVGVLAREDPMLMTPVWIFERRSVVMFSAIACLGAFLLPRFLIPARSQEPYVGYLIDQVTEPVSWPFLKDFVGEGIFSWGALWIYLGVGLWLLLQQSARGKRLTLVALTVAILLAVYAFALRFPPMRPLMYLFPMFVPAMGACLARLPKAAWMAVVPLLLQGTLRWPSFLERLGLPTGDTRLAQGILLLNVAIALVVAVRVIQAELATSGRALIRG